MIIIKCDKCGDYKTMNFPKWAHRHWHSIAAGVHRFGMRLKKMDLCRSCLKDERTKLRGLSRSYQNDVDPEEFGK